jgi:hypothetical protein
VLACAAASLSLGSAATASPKGADWAVIEDAAGCGSCHLGAPDPAASPDATDSPGLVIEGLPPRALPGTTYALQIVLTDSALRIAGFLLEVTSDTQPSGQIASMDAATESLGARARSTRAGALPAAPGVMRWRVAWIAPQSLAGPIRFEVWANAGNDDLSPLGDRLHHRVFEIPAGD